MGMVSANDKILKILNRGADLRCAPIHGIQGCLATFGCIGRYFRNGGGGQCLNTAGDLFEHIRQIPCHFFHAGINTSQLFAIIWYLCDGQNKTFFLVDELFAQDSQIFGDLNRVGLMAFYQGGRGFAY